MPTYFHHVISGVSKISQVLNIWIPTLVDSRKDSKQIVPESGNSKLYVNSQQNESNMPDITIMVDDINE